MPDEIGNEKTLFMYLPWSSNLTGYFYQNIADMESCIEELGGLSDERVVVFISTSSTEASLFEIVCENGKCQRLDINHTLILRSQLKRELPGFWMMSYPMRRQKDIP